MSFIYSVSLFLIFLAGFFLFIIVCGTLDADLLPLHGNVGSSVEKCSWLQTFRRVTVSRKINKYMYIQYIKKILKVRRRAKTNHLEAYRKISRIRHVAPAATVAFTIFFAPDHDECLFIRQRAKLMSFGSCIFKWPVYRVNETETETEVKNVSVGPPRNFQGTNKKNEITISLGHIFS